MVRNKTANVKPQNASRTSGLQLQGIAAGTAEVHQLPSAVRHFDAHWLAAHLNGFHLTASRCLLRLIAWSDETNTVCSGVDGASIC